MGKKRSLGPLFDFVEIADVIKVAMRKKDGLDICPSKTKSLNGSFQLGQFAS